MSRAVFCLCITLLAGCFPAFGPANGDFGFFLSLTISQQKSVVREFTDIELMQVYFEDLIYYHPPSLVPRSEILRRCDSFSLDVHSESVSQLDSYREDLADEIIMDLDKDEIIMDLDKNGCR